MILSKNPHYAYYLNEEQKDAIDKIMSLLVSDIITNETGILTDDKIYHRLGTIIGRPLRGTTPTAESLHDPAAIPENPFVTEIKRDTASYKEDSALHNQRALFITKNLTSKHYNRLFFQKN